MWQHAESRTVDIKGSKGFALPGATRHYAPDRQADVSRIVIEIWIDRAKPRIRGRVSIELSALVSTARLDLDAQELEIQRVADGDGAALAHELEDGHLSVSFARPLAVAEHVKLIVDYAGEPRRGMYFIGPNALDPARPSEVWTQGQDEDSRHWFPCFDFPNQKATTEVIAHVAPGLFALSNGVLVEKRESPEEHVYHYRQDVRHSTYLVTLVVGEYAAIEHAGARVPVVSYVHPRNVEEGKLTFSRTAEMVELFSRKIGIPYAFPRYAQICVADFIFGGMENTTATTLTEQILFDQRSEVDYRRVAESLISHELAHQWWGDLVTCADWSHAWLNEGFATYFESVWREHAEDVDEASYARLLDQEAYFAETYRRPLVERTYEEPIDLFDRHQYEKGACVLHLVRFMLGDADFWRVLQRYAEQHRADIVKTADLERAILDVTGRNLESTFDQWVYSPGHPQITLNGAWDAEEKAFNLTVEQTQRGDRIPEAFAFPVDIEVVTEDGPEVHRARIEARKQTIRLACPKRPSYVVFDKGGHVLKQVDCRLSSQILRALLEKSRDVHALIIACRALVKRGDPASVRAVIKALGTHPLHGVRAEAAKALKRASGKEPKDALIKAVLEDADPRVRRSAIRALSAYREHAEEITKVLVDHCTVKEPSDYTVADAMRTVAELRTSRARPFLDLGLERTGHNSVVRAAAVESLAKLRDLSSLAAVAKYCDGTQHTRVREAAVSALGALGKYAPESSLERAEARDRLVDYLDDPWLRVRMRAAEALKSLGEKNAVNELKDRAEKELDGRARRAMRLAERELREGTHSADEMDRLRDEVRLLEQSQGKLQDRLEKLEAKRREAAKSAAAASAGAPAEEKRKKKRKKK